MRIERDQIPDWAARERQRDLAWIHQNLDLFWETAVQAEHILGRGAIIVDVTSRPMANGNFFTYFTQVEIERYGDEHIDRLVAQYKSGQEFVVVLLKPENKSSAYQLRSFPPSGDMQ